MANIKTRNDINIKKIREVVISFGELRQNKNRVEDIFLLVYKSDDGLNILGCNDLIELKGWATFFGKIESIKSSERRLILKCNVLDPYDLPYEVESDKYVWVFVENRTMHKYANIKSASRAIERFIEEGVDDKPVAIRDISVISGIIIDAQNVTIYF